NGIEAFENGDAILVSNGTGRLVKKVRHRSEEPLDLDDPVVNDRGMKVDSVGFQSISWKDKLLRGTIAKKVDAKKEDDFQLLKGDARTKIVDEGLYTKSLLKVIGSAIGLIAKIDQNTDNNSIGQFARFAAYIDLGNPFFSKVKIDGRIQYVEYESLPLVCFGCERKAEGSRFEMLSENHEGIEDSGSSDLNNNRGNLDSGTVIVGINELAKEKTVTQIKSKGFKKESNMSKDKWVVIENRLPANSNILKPNNKQGLNKRKNMVMKILSFKGDCGGEENLERTTNKKLKETVGEVFGQRPVVTPNNLSRNTDQGRILLSEGAPTSLLIS
ncbi:hypothetical protein Gorai_022442, partial [Gossypium raimondii]|nr:hypothetical protein [Gossypium raimondii]